MKNGVHCISICQAGYEKLFFAVAIAVKRMSAECISASALTSGLLNHNSVK